MNQHHLPHELAGQMTREKTGEHFQFRKKNNNKTKHFQNEIQGHFFKIPKNQMLRLNSHMTSLIFGLSQQVDKEIQGSPPGTLEMTAYMKALYGAWQGVE